VTIQPRPELVILGAVGLRPAVPCRARFLAVRFLP
jgi:hypothetical protein